ncbi:pyruvate dehydrogenase E1 component beta subunit [Nematocida sp. AWRm80]|nr:pyruvate dehydrogenase E1 component beta subunit [Nematocida sp. AWRm80]
MKGRISGLIKGVIRSEMKRDPMVYILGEEVGVYGGAYQCTAGLLDEFGSGRVIDTPISEIGFTGMAVGSAWCGLKPICEFMTFNFALQSMDHIINSAAKTLYMSGGRMACPIVFRGPNGYSPGVGAQHTQDFASFLAAIPGLKVVSPYTARDHVGLLRAAIRDSNPVVVLESEVLYPKEMDYDPEILNDDYMLPLDKALVECQGTDITLVGTSISVGLCLEVQKQLLEKDISVEVINMVCINPLDIDTVEKSVRKTRRLVVVDWGWPECSIPTEVCYSITTRLSSDLAHTPVTMSSKKVPTPYAEELEQLMYPSVTNILDTVTQIVSETK